MTPAGQNSTYDHTRSMLISDCPTYSVVSDHQSCDNQSKQEFIQPSPKLSTLGIISPAKPVYQQTQRTKKLIKAIENSVSRIQTPFDLSLLEKQALLYLRLEDESATRHRKNLMPTPLFKRIVCACCYLQHL